MSENTKLVSDAKLVIPAMMVPGYRTALAVQNGVEKNILIKTWGGLGDQICAEPTLRYCIKIFKNCEITLATQFPELFKHLKFDNVIDLNNKKQVNKLNLSLNSYLTFETITQPNDTNLVWQFFSHMLTHCVDFTSLCVLRMQLPILEKEVKLVGTPPKETLELLKDKKYIVIHPGKHWQSKTFPKEFWDTVIDTVIANEVVPVIIGADTDDNRGTVEVKTEGCLDLRNKLSIMETIGFLQNSKVLLTNDSSPLHMAVDSECWIGFVATCKHPDHIMHWRRGEWAYKMKNFGLGGVWDIVDMTPNTDKEILVENVGDENLKSWLPNPVEFAEWGVSKV